MIEDCSFRMIIKGCVSCRVFVNSRFILDEVIRVIKVDFIRSLISRCELLSEDIDVIEEEISIKEFYDIFIRVFGCLFSSIIEFCDYVF